MTPERVADFSMTHPIGYYSAGLIRRMPSRSAINLTNFDALRAEIDLIVYVMFIVSALVTIVVYSIACYAENGATQQCVVCICILYIRIMLLIFFGGIGCV
jgi:hypothetical protein